MSAHVQILTVVSFMGAAFLGHAQSSWQPVAKERFIAAKATCDSLYLSMGDFALSAEFLSYRSFDDAAPIDRLIASIVRDGHRFRSEIGGYITVQDERVRLTMDPVDKVVMVSSPVDLSDPYALMSSLPALTAVTTCAVRQVSEGVEYRIVFAPGGVYDHVIVWYDEQGWLRRSETVWRVPIESHPGARNSAAYRPKLVVRYERPTPLRTAAIKEVVDPWVYIKETTLGPVAIGKWAGLEIIDVRITP